MHISSVILNLVSTVAKLSMHAGPSERSVQAVQKEMLSFIDKLYLVSGFWWTQEIFCCLGW